jgi:hypothetical protein
LHGKNPFSVWGERGRVLIDIDAVAAQISSMNVRHPLRGFERFAHSATIYFTPEIETIFCSQIRQIRQYLQQHIASVVGGNDAIADFVASLIESLESRFFQGSSTDLCFK